MSKVSKVYKPLEVNIWEITGVQFSLDAMRLPKQQITITTMKQDLALAAALIKSGDDHAKAMRGIIVWMEIKLQTGFMIEFETYRAGVECLSTSSAMHGELKHLKGSELAEAKQQGLTEKVYTRKLIASYQALRHMYGARRNHRHPDWRIMCNAIETLPHFDKLIFPEFDGTEVELLK